MGKQAFVSHIAEEAKVASHLKSCLKRDFLGNLDVFVSSDGDGIGAGDDWFKCIDSAIRNSELMLILCSPASVRRPWISFEAGAAWMLGKPLIPLCHAGLTVRDLSVPMSYRQGLLLYDPAGVELLYKRVAETLNCDVPHRSFEDMATSLKKVSDDIPRGKQEQLWLDVDRDIKRRLDEALLTNYNWRTIKWVAAAAGVSEEIAADRLRADPNVKFSRGKSGNMIVGLRSRVR
jgi:hypothetical protein